ncbi:MAG: hypothetical protein KKA73_16025 [Chloroflexi bacterium]|nr:hypothetical protein [Chloroflexota bacterium]
MSQLSLSGFPPPYPRRQRRERWRDWEARRQAFETAWPDHPQVAARRAAAEVQARNAAWLTTRPTGQQPAHDHHAWTCEQGLLRDEPPTTWQPVAFVFTHGRHGLSHRIGFWVNNVQLRFLVSRWTGVPLPPRRLAERCMQWRPHPCFRPAGEPQWVDVSATPPPACGEFELIEPPPAHWRLCCPEAARLLIRELHGQGWRHLQLAAVTTTAETQDYADYLNVTMPCLGSVG